MSRTPKFHPPSRTSNWPLVHYQYIRKDKLLIVRFTGPPKAKNNTLLYDTAVAPPDTPPGPLADMTVSSLGSTKRIASIEFWNTQSPPKTMNQLYDPFRDILMLLFTDRTPDPEDMPDLSPTFHQDILLYLDQDQDPKQNQESNSNAKVIGIVILCASHLLMKE